MTDPPIIPLEEYVRDKLIPAPGFVLSLDLRQVRNLLDGAGLAAGPPSHPTAGIVITVGPEEGQFLGTPTALGGGELEFVALGWNLTGDRVDCGSSFRFAKGKRKGLGTATCSGACTQGRCRPVTCFTKRGLTFTCACTRRKELLGRIR